jgi:hypothetical protein
MVLDKLRDYPIEIHLMNGYNVFLGFIRTILLSDFSLFQAKKNPPSGAGQITSPKEET